MLRVAMVFAAIVFIIFLVNRQWLREVTLVNSPSYDALVYQNQSYDDYLLIRRDGVAAVLKKYSAGNWHVPPLFFLSGTFFYLLFGLDPANFYVTPAICFYLLVLGTYGFVHFWTERRGWAILAAAMVLTSHSVITWGLRVSQTDFAVGALFTWTFYLLVASDGLRSRRASLFYAISVSACVLMKSSIVPYFLAQAVVWLVYVARDPKHRVERLLNTALVGLGVLVLAGWFFIFNYGQILRYYTRWGGELSQVTRAKEGIETVWDDLLFYLRTFQSFHLVRNVPLFGLTALLAAMTCIGGLALSRGMLHDRRTWLGLGVACIWLAIPYGILSMYASKAASVDFPFMPAFFIIPVMLAATVFRGRAVLIGLLLFAPFLLVQTRDQMHSLVQAPPRQDWREREILADILKDADRRGVGKFYVTNAFVHRHLTSENLRFFVVNGSFGQAYGRYNILPYSYFFDAQSFFDLLMRADYILAKSGDQEPATHPNNVLAPEANRLLAASPSVVPVNQYELPDSSTLTIYRNETRSGFNHPPPSPDGWIRPRFPLTFYGLPKDWHLQLHGRILLPPGLSFPAHVWLEDERGEVVSERVPIANSESFLIRLSAPASAFSATGEKTRLYLMTDRPYNPAQLGVSGDNRQLSMIFISLGEVPP